MSHEEFMDRIMLKDPSIKISSLNQYILEDGNTLLEILKRVEAAQEHEEKKADRLETQLKGPSFKRAIFMTFNPETLMLTKIPHNFIFGSFLYVPLPLDSKQRDEIIIPPLQSHEM